MPTSSPPRAAEAGLVFLDGDGRVLALDESAAAVFQLGRAGAAGRALDCVPGLEAWSPLFRQVMDTQAPIARLPLPGRGSWRASLHPMPEARGVLLLLEDEAPDAPPG
jgi:hypothetical protein